LFSSSSFYFERFLLFFHLLPAGELATIFLCSSGLVFHHGCSAGETPMKKYRKHKCRHCHEFFVPDPRNRHHQHYCSRAACRKASKAASQRRWLSKPENRNYFRGSAHVARVRAWRAVHPGYRKRTGIQGEKALQDRYPVQSADKQGHSGDLTGSSLQDLLSRQPLVLIGLIAQLTDSTLQEDIAQSGRALLQLGQDILFGAGCAQGGCHAKTSVDSIARAPGPPAV
jgi:hypothetical protein